MLRLSIENTPSLTSGDPIEVVLQEHGLVIGRAAHADWTLPDARNHISSIHCEIDYRDGRYHLTDRSTNGTFINGAGERLSKPTQLRDGDLIQIGQYEIRVEEEASAISQPVAGSAPISPPSTGINWDVDAPAARPIPTGQFGREPARPVFQNAADPLMGSYSAPSAGGDPFGLGAMSGRALPSSAPVSDDPFGLSGATAAARPAGHDDLFGLSGSAPPSGDPFGLSSAPPIIPPTPSRPPQADPFGLPSSAPPSNDPSGLGGATSPVTPVPVAPPSNDPWATLSSVSTLDFSTAATIQPPPPPPPTSSAAPASPAAALPPTPTADTGLFNRLLAAAGLKREDMGDATPESVVEVCGQLLRQTADGLIRLLDARTRVRHQFGVGAQVTTFQRAGNNPLKWTRSPEHALKQMIGTGEPGFLTGSDSVRGAFEDIQAHEMAMIAAMQEAMHATISRFAPETMKQRIGARGWLKSVLPGSREATLWRAYESEFRTFADESEAAYLDLFARHFKTAYEKNVIKTDQR